MSVKRETGRMSQSPDNGSPFPFLDSTSAKSYRTVGLITFAIVVVTAILNAAAGCAIERFAHGDACLALDFGWRIRNGLVPHVDYNSALGPLYYWVVAAGMAVKGHTADALVWSKLL